MVGFSIVNLKPKGFDGDQTPLKIDDILQISENANEEASSDLEDGDITSGDYGI